MGDSPKPKKRDPGLVTVLIALILGAAWLAQGILSGEHVRKSPSGMAAFLVAFVVLLVVASLLKLKR